jgi:hypothetical protein
MNAEAQKRADQQFVSVAAITLNLFDQYVLGRVALLPMPADMTQVRLGFCHLVCAKSSIDPMDALHIAIGTQLNITHFATFDAGWQEVDQITVVC